MATLDDIAGSLGITKGTVSKALNGASDISEATRKIVLERAVELGYSKISRQNSGKVCIFIENMKWKEPEDFGYELITGFRKMAEPAGYKVDVIELTYDIQNSMTYDMYMLLNNYQGAFAIGISYSDPWIKIFSESKTPLVLFDYEVGDNPHASMICVNNEEAFNLSVAYLKSLGHKKIGYLSAKLGSYIFQQRYHAFFNALKHNHLKADHSLAIHDYYVVEKLDQEIPTLMEKGCTALLCSHDEVAHAVLIYCKEHGIRIPEDLNVIGYDDLPTSLHTDPPLTTIRQDRIELGKSAYFALSCQISDIALSSLQLHPKLITRKTTGLHT